MPSGGHPSGEHPSGEHPSGEHPSGWRTSFSEVMTGPGRLWEAGTSQRTSCCVELDVDVPELLHPGSDVHAELRGRVSLGGLADDPAATGSLHIAPLTRKRIGYRLDFRAADGRALCLDGWKSLSYRRLLASSTTLPATITDTSGLAPRVLGEVLLRFSIPAQLPAMLASLGLTRRRGARNAPEGSAAAESRDAPERQLARRWNGRPGRLEVWYTTVTDPATGTGLWVHHELVAPSGGGPAQHHGWAAVFPPAEEPHFARFGPYPDDAAGHAANGAMPVLNAERVAGAAGELRWDLSTAAANGTAHGSNGATGSAEGAGATDSAAGGSGGTDGTLYTFPRWAWDTALLPGAQVVPQPRAQFSGTVGYGNTSLRLDAAPGATAHIYGHGNAHRWAWLHADLGDGDIAEVVAAVSRRPGLRALPALPFVRLRVDGKDIPAGDTLIAALRLRARIGLPTWRVSGRLGGYRLGITVTQPPEATVAVDYQDPDGAAAVCHNTERATARITLDRPSGRPSGRLSGLFSGRGWVRYREWYLDGTAHAEVGTRDPAAGDPAAGER